MSANIQDVQALILLGSCLRNQGNAEASWTLVGACSVYFIIFAIELIFSTPGVTIRLAQGLGMHIAVDPSTIVDPVKKEEAETKRESGELEQQKPQSCTSPFFYFPRSVMFLVG